MKIEEAKNIYSNPKGHSKEELRECLRMLNEASQPVELGNLQFVAIRDAISRLGVDKRDVLYVSLEDEENKERSKAMAKWRVPELPGYFDEEGYHYKAYITMDKGEVAFHRGIAKVLKEKELVDKYRKGEGNARGKS